MYTKLIKNDMVKNKFINLITLLFVTAAALLVSLATILTVNLSGAIDALMTQAKTPHFLQMHSGELNNERLEAFANQNDKVEAFQVLSFLNIKGNEIKIGEGTLEKSVQDNGFCVQSKSFDYLLDLEGQIIQVKKGEVYVPICYMQDGTAKIGDQMTIGNTQLIVAGFLRDSQMNSLLASSKRFLISEEDYKAIEPLGSPEYLIEFRVKDLKWLSTFENDYSSAELESNGPTITYGLFKLINAFTDGTMIAIILVVSLLVTAIALMCIRFTLLTKIEEDYKEIGVLKAIGLRLMDIKKIYLVKYAAISAGGCLLGFILSLPLKGTLLKNIVLNMGEGPYGAIAPVFGTLGVMLVAIIILLYVNGVLKRFKKISAAEAIRFGMAQERTKSTKHFLLKQNKYLNVNIFLGLKDVLIRKKLYRTMFLITILSTFIMSVPKNIYHTISSNTFLGMGTGSCDMRIDIQQTDNVQEKANQIAEVMSQDPAISKYVVLTTKTFMVQLEDGTEEQIKVELGDHTTFPDAYSQGKAPITDNEISLSALNAQAFDKKMGDVMTVVVDGQPKQFTVCGIYSDITNGGKSAKVHFTTTSGEVMWSTICCEIPDKDLVSEKIQTYKSQFPFATVAKVDEFMNQTFGPTRKAIGTASTLAMIVALLLLGLITLLFMKMLVAKDRYSIAAIKALGFNLNDLTIQYMTRSLTIVLLGIIIGTGLANTLGQMLVGVFMASLGGTSFKFVIHPLSAYVLMPFMMIGVGLIATYKGISNINEIKISENIKE